MPVRIGSGLSTAPDARAAAEQAAGAALEQLDGAACDVCVLFASGAHLAAPEATIEAVDDVLAPGRLIGCGAQGVLAGGHEVERGTGVAIWAASLGAGTASAFHTAVAERDGGLVADLPDLTGASAAILLADPFTFPADAILHAMSETVPQVPVLGGLASARLGDGSPALFLDGGVAEGGAVGLRFDGVEVQACVSQGAAPLGPELTITACEGNIILELAGRTAYEKLQEVVAVLTDEEQVMLERSGGILLGIVVDPNKPDYVQGDFLVRPLIGGDPRTGALAVGAVVRPGQVVRLHARDADSADRDLRDALERPPDGARRPARRCAGVRLQRPGRGDVRHAGPRRRRRRRGARRRPERRLLLRRRDRAGRRRVLPARLHRDDRAVRALFGPMNLSSRRVLLTGATGGIGHAIARELSARGAELVLTGRRTDVLEPLAAELGAQALAVDLSDRADVERLIADAGRIDVLVANAALPGSGPLFDYAIEEIDRALEVNLRAPMVLARVLGEGMTERRDGHLVFISSLAGKVVPTGSSVYSATKAGLRAFAQGLRQDLRGSGVGVSCVFPGFISDAGMYAETGVDLPRGVGTKRPGDVADAVVKAIETNRGEIDVAPVPVRLGAVFGAVAPGISATLQRKLGSEKISDAMGEAQKVKR